MAKKAKPKADWVVCAKCAQLDKTDRTSSPHHIGTKTVMQCPDCSTGESRGRATLCRRCCPTNHCTFLYQGGV